MLTFWVLEAAASALSGYVATEGSLFTNSALFAEQRRNNASFALQAEYYNEWENGSSFTLTPFIRLDRYDSRRTHLDIRELNFLWLGNMWELRVGIGKVFWGTTEFVHLVDIINQTDAVESIDGEDKLGQPMVHLSLSRSWGVIDVFVLPYFRERTFPGSRGRLRLPLGVDADNARYESDYGKRHIDFALRYSHTIRDWDFGVYHFSGTGREPTLLLGSNEDGGPVFIPYYQQIDQTGLDLQRVAGEWLFKLEAVYRRGQGNDFLAAVGGFEYTLVGLSKTGADLGVVGQWAYDGRSDDATTPYENDAMFGLRLVLNDPAGSEVLAGMTQDINTSARAVSIEASRRINSNWKATLEARAFFDLPEDDLFYSLRDDDFLRFELAYHF
jgi:hypothetical protein